MALRITGRINQQLYLIRTEIAATTKRCTVAGKGAMVEDCVKGTEVIKLRASTSRIALTLTGSRYLKESCSGWQGIRCYFCPAVQVNLYSLGEERIDIEASQILETRPAFSHSSKNVLLFLFDCLETTS